MVQILILAAVAAFLFWRLSIVLGIRTGFEKVTDIKPIDSSKKSGTNSAEPISENSGDDDISDYIELSSCAGKKLKDIKLVEPNFSVKNFVTGAKTAYELILMAFEKGDLSILEKHLAEEVYKDFKNVVTDRANNGYKVDATFIGVREIRIKDVSFDKENLNAEIKMLFKCELTSVVRDKDDNIVEGSPTAVKKHTDLWTFGRLMGTNDPSWKLIATGE